MISPVVRLEVPKLANTFSIEANLTLLANDNPLIRSLVSDQWNQLDGNVLFYFCEHENIGNCF